jgi:hypothetical protein
MLKTVFAPTIYIDTDQNSFQYDFLYNMGGKRPSSGSSSGGPVPKGSRRAGKADAAEEPMTSRLGSMGAKAKIASAVWWEPFIDEVNRILTIYGTPSAYLDSVWPDSTALQTYAKVAEEMFPSLPGKDYMTAIGWDTPGRKLFRFWEASWKVNAGNSGWVDFERFKTIVQLIAVFGPETDPLIPGTELPLITRPNHAFGAADGPSFCGVDPTPTVLNSPGIHGVHFAKGWKRLLGTNFVVTVLHQLNLVAEFKRSTSKDVLMLFSCCHGMVPDKDPEDLIDMNRGKGF